MGIDIETMPGAPHREYERVAAPGDEDYKHDDPIQRRAATEQRTRDYFVLVEQAKLVREGLKDCYRREGVNYQQNCADKAVKYMGLVTRIKQAQYGPKVVIAKPAADDDY